MKFTYKMVCLLLLVLSASFGVGGCYLLYSDFSAQLSRVEAANADTHRQICTLLQGEILDRQRRGESLDDAALIELLQDFAQPTALWRDGVCLAGEGDPLPDGTMEVHRLADGGVQATYASNLQGGLQLATAYDLTDLYQGRDAALRRFLLLEAAVLAAGAAVTAVLASRMTRPLRTLTAASAEIADGDYARRTGLHTGDEIETLSSSFDKMADAVQEKITALQADVQQREDFMGAFAHELKTPMTSIIGYADMLRTIQATPAEQHEAAGAIYHEGRRLEALSIRDFGIIHDTGNAIRVRDGICGVQIVHSTLQCGISVAARRQIPRGVQIDFRQQNIAEDTVILHLVGIRVHGVGIFVAGDACGIGGIGLVCLAVAKFDGNNTLACVNKSSAAISCGDVGIVVGVAQPNRLAVQCFGDFKGIRPLA